MHTSMVWRRIVSNFKCCTAFAATCSQRWFETAIASACTFRLDASWLLISCDASASDPPTSCSSYAAYWVKVVSRVPLFPPQTQYSPARRSALVAELLSTPALTPKRLSTARLLKSPEPDGGPTASLSVGPVTAGGAGEMVTTEGLHAADTIHVEVGFGGRFMERL